MLLLRCTNDLESKRQGLRITTNERELLLYEFKRIQDNFDDLGSNGYTHIYRVITTPHRNILDATTYFIIRDSSRITYLDIYMFTWF